MSRNFKTWRLQLYERTSSENILDIFMKRLEWFSTGLLAFLF